MNNASHRIGARIVALNAPKANPKATGKLKKCQSTFFASRGSFFLAMLLLNPSGGVLPALNQLNFIVARFNSPLKPGTAYEA